MNLSYNDNEDFVRFFFPNMLVRYESIHDINSCNFFISQIQIFDYGGIDHDSHAHS